MRLNITSILSFILLSLILLFCCACGGDADSDETGGDTETTDGDDAPDGDNEADGDSVENDAGEADMDSDGDGDGDATVQCSEPISERVIEMAADETFFVGPYLQQPMPDSMIVKWRTEAASDGKVLYGESEALGSEAAHEGTAEIHEVKLSGLKENTRYFYKVQSGETVSAMHHFYTAPAPGSAFRFTVWADNHTGTDTFGALSEQMASFNPWFILGVGDLVQSGKNENEWRELLFNPARALLHETAFYSAVGSHEENADIMFEYYSFPYPEGRPEWEATYSFTYGNAFFLVIDAQQFFAPVLGIENDFSLWIREQAASEAAQKATWRFALSHEAGYSEGWSNGRCWFEGNMQVRDWLMPLLSENGFHALFSGHTHAYERGMADGLAYFITGGGGGGLDSWCRDLETTSVVYYDFHHLVVDAGCDALKIGAYNLAKEKFDWIEIEADNPGVLSDEGPMDGLPDPPINSDSSTLTDGDDEGEAESTK